MRKFLILLMVVLLVSVGCSSEVDLDDELSEYSIVNIEEIESEEIINWYESNIAEQGHYTYQVDNTVYLLIAAGEKPTSGYSVELEDESYLEGAFSAKAILIRPSEDDVVAMVITYPALLLEFSNTSNLDVDLDLSDFEEEVSSQAGFPHVLARYNGQIDNNSIEVDTTTSFQLQEYASEIALRFNEELLEEQTEIIESIEIGDFILFNTHQDEHGRFILDEILDVGYDNKTHQIEGIYLGRIDSNFIEVEVNTYAMVFKFHMDLEEELHGEIELEDILNIEYKIGEDGHRVVKNIIVN